MGSVALTVLLLADGRFPAGGHAHSAGVEAAVADGRVSDRASLEEFARGRLWTAGLADAALAAATVERVRQGPGPDAAGLLGVLRELDAEAHARVTPQALRTASRRLGRQLVRAAERCWPAPVLAAARVVDPVGPHQPVALGAAAVAAGLDAAATAGLAVHHTLTTPVQAAVRLLGLDPFDAAGVVAGLSGEGEAVVREALSTAAGPLAELPCRAGLRADIAASHHAGSDRRLFAT